MKKYRLIELGDNYPQKLETYASFEEAATAMRNLMAGNRNNFYRIEEVEESITDRVKSYEDACRVLGTRQKWNLPKQRIGVIKDFVDKTPEHITALLKLETITAALNEGWKPDWEDEMQEKWGVQLDSRTNTALTLCKHSVSNTSSSLYFKSRELAEYAAKQFAELYKQLLIEKL